MRPLSKLMLAIAFLSFVIPQNLIAQEKKKLPKFGKISKAELDMKAYELDPEARAVVLFDRGVTDFIFNATDGFQTSMKRHVRIKIFNKTGFDWGDFTIPFYDSNRGEIKIQSLKGITCYYENGNIKVSKLDKGNIFDEETGRYWRQKKFSMPQLNEGCVIDLTYEIVSDFLQEVPKWQFQYDIPVVWSQYETRIPEYFKYSQNFQGYIPIKIHKTNNSSGSISYTPQGRSIAPTTSGRGKDISRLEYSKTDSFFAIPDVPALKEEPYTSSMLNFYTTIFFELAQTTFPGQFDNNISTTWDDVDETMIQNVNFGGQARKGGFLKEEIQTIKGKYDEPKAQIVAIYEYIKSKVNWNGEYSEFAQKGINKAFKDGEGNVGDLNLMLTAALRNAGFNANPVLLSTRTNGLIPLTRPSFNCFNYVIAAVQMDEKIMLLDATSKNSTAGMLPRRCLNGKGRLMDQKGCGWVDLTSKIKHDFVAQYDVVLDEQMNLNGKLNYICKDYSAYNCRIEMSELGGKDAYVKAIVKENPSLKINEQTIEATDLYAPVKTTFDITYSDAITNTGNLIYLNPMLSEAMTENPFKSETRQYPVDFAYPIKKTYVFKMPIPEGYTIDELPEKLVIALPKKSGKYTYTAIETNGMLNIISKFEIRKAIFLPEEYPYLREFYDQAIQKQAEQIVLVKG